MGLSQEEFLEFLEYVKSPTGGNSSIGGLTLSKIGELIKEDQDIIYNSTLYQRVYPDEKYNGNRLNQTISKLNKMLNAFFIDKELKSDEVLQKTLLLKAYKSRGIENHFDSIFKKAKTQIDSESSVHSLYHRNQIFALRNDYLINKLPKITHTGLKEVFFSLEEYYVLQKLKYQIAALNEAIYFGREIPEIALQRVVYEHISPKGKPLYSVYQRAYDLMFSIVMDKGSSQDLFHELKEALFSFSNLERTEAIDLYTYSVNFCTLQIQKGYRSFALEIIELYESLLEKGFLFVNRKLPLIWYKNIVVIMCRNKQFTWVDQFIEDYRTQILFDKDEQSYFYNRAVLKFHQGDFEETYQILNPRINKFNNVHYSLDARAYYCKALFELEKFDLLENALDAMRVFIPRQGKCSNFVIEKYKSFCRHFTSFVKIYTGYPERMPEQLQNLKARIHERKDTQVAGWILEKIDSKI